MHSRRPLAHIQSANLYAAAMASERSSPVRTVFHRYFDEDNFRGTELVPSRTAPPPGMLTGLEAPRPRQTLAMARTNSNTTINSAESYDGDYAERAQEYNYWNPYGNVAQSCAYSTLRVLAEDATARCGPQSMGPSAGLQRRFYRQLGLAQADFFYKHGYRDEVIADDGQIEVANTSIAPTPEDSAKIFAALVQANIVRACIEHPGLFEPCASAPVTAEEMGHILAELCTHADAESSEAFAYTMEIVFNAWRDASYFTLAELIDIYQLDCRESAFTTPEHLDVYSVDDPARIIADTYTGIKSFFSRGIVPDVEQDARRARLAAAKAHANATLKGWADDMAVAAASNFG